MNERQIVERATVLAVEGKHVVLAGKGLLFDLVLSEFVDYTVEHAMGHIAQWNVSDNYYWMYNTGGTVHVVDFGSTYDLGFIETFPSDLVFLVEDVESEYWDEYNQLLLPMLCKNAYGKVEEVSLESCQSKND